MRGVESPREIDGPIAPRTTIGELASADELGLHPLLAHCHLSLGAFHRRTGKREQAQEHLTPATTMSSLKVIALMG